MVSNSFSAPSKLSVSAAAGFWVGVGIGWLLLRAAVFIAAALLAGVRLVPWLMSQVAQSGSSELFILTTATLALGVSSLSAWLGLSAALGAFLAGLMLSLFVRRRRVWVRASAQDDGRTLVAVGGLARAESGGLAGEVDALVERLRAAAPESAPEAAAPEEDA